MTETSPMDPTTQEKLVKRLHAHPDMIVLVITGGGSSAIGSLLRQGGASNTLLDAEVPYAASALIRWLGKEPEQFCSDATARAMAMVAFERAKHLYDEEADQAGQPQIPLAGISCTASLASNRPKRGEHRIHLAAQTSECTWTSHLRLIKGRRTRQQEEDLAGDMLVQWITRPFGLSQKWDLPLADGEEIQTHKMVAPVPWQELLSGTRKKVLALGERGNETQQVRALFPGAFNPLHQGHLLIAKIAGKKLGVAVDFELSTLNVDKPPLDYWEMQQRLKQFTDQLSDQQFSIGQRNEKKRLWFTRAPTFEDKAELFPGATFVVGVDTIRRIADPKYYGHSQNEMELAVGRIAQAGCRFLVFGRQENNRFLTRNDLRLPAVLDEICDGVSENEFRQDISSTQLRKQAGAL